MHVLQGKTALVTGGSRGIGAAIARRLAADGADVAVTYVAAEEKAETVKADIESMGRRGLAIRADAAERHAVVDVVETTADRFGHIDILVNNAGIFPYGPPVEVEVDELDRTLAIHVRAVFLAAQAALKHMPDQGRIISVGSSLSARVPAPGTTLYAMSKSALVGFTKGLAQDVGHRGITVNLVNPGSTDTDMNPEDGAQAAAERAMIPLGRYGKAEDIAAVVAFLAGPGGRHVTGATIAVDGGAST